MKEKIGLIGVGNMGTAILEGVLRNKIATPSQIWVYDKVALKAKNFARRTGVHVASSVRDLLDKTRVVVLAQKPQDFAPFAAEHKHGFRPCHCVISILAGLTTEKIRKAFGKRVKVVRAMPNLGAKVGQSVTAVCGNPPRWISFSKRFFAGCGTVVRVPERSFDLVTAVSGSGPAYFFHLMELMTDFGASQGLPADLAATLAVQTGLGAALLAKQSKDSCAQLRQKVTSKKGTTEAAFKALERGKFKKVFSRALAAAMKRSRQLRS